MDHDSNSISDQIKELAEKMLTTPSDKMRFRILKRSGETESFRLVASTFLDIDMSKRQEVGGVSK
jgi:hypothetical protein